MGRGQPPPSQRLPGVPMLGYRGRHLAGRTPSPFLLGQPLKQSATGVRRGLPGSEKPSPQGLPSYHVLCKPWLGGLGGCSLHFHQHFAYLNNIPRLGHPLIADLSVLWFRMMGWVNFNSFSSFKFPRYL